MTQWHVSWMIWRIPLVLQKAQTEWEKGVISLYRYYLLKSWYLNILHTGNLHWKGDALKRNHQQGWCISRTAKRLDVRVPVGRKGVRVELNVWFMLAFERHFFCCINTTGVSLLSPYHKTKLTNCSVVKEFVLCLQEDANSTSSMYFAQVWKDLSPRPKLISRGNWAGGKRLCSRPWWRMRSQPGNGLDHVTIFCYACNHWHTYTCFLESIQGQISWTIWCGTLYWASLSCPRSWLHEMACSAFFQCSRCTCRHYKTERRYLKTQKENQF